VSRTTIKLIWPGERHEDGEELPNSWGSAPYVWSALSKRYIGDVNWLSRDGEKLWRLWEREDIPLHQRSVLVMTFDRAYIERRDYDRAARDIELFLADFPPNGAVNHWPRIAAILRSDPAPAVGFHMTSVTEDPFEGPWNEEREEHGPTDWSRCFSVYKDRPEATP